MEQKLAESPPLISVIMPVHNGMPFLQQAVNSILSQTYKNFEFIIIDDCSNDGTTEFLGGISDPRIVVIELMENCGITKALQHGMFKAKGEFIARLDADDIAMPDRLEKQQMALSQDSSIGLLGTGYCLINERDQLLRQVSIAKDDLEIRWDSLFRNPFVHSTVMFRRKTIDEANLGYSRPYGEDYQLWTDILRYSKGRIIEDVLIKYRTHKKSWTFTKSNSQHKAYLDIVRTLITRYISIHERDDVWLEEFIMWVRGRSRRTSRRNWKEFKESYQSLLQSFVACEIDRTMEREEFLQKKMKRLEGLRRAKSSTITKLFRLADRISNRL